MFLRWLQRRYLIAFAIGLLVGMGMIYFFAADTSSPAPKKAMSDKPDKTDKDAVWTCSMHPEVEKSEPGQCPICGMDLIKRSATSSQITDQEITMSEEAAKLARLQTSKVEKKVPIKKLYLPGKVVEDERRIKMISARFGGRLEQLNVNFKGQYVRKGEVLGKIYSPELVAAQQELLQALKNKESNPELYRSARNKLKLWNLTEAQINAIEKRKKVKEVLPVVAPLTGVVKERKVQVGDYVKEGTPLFRIAGLSRVWVHFDVYENQLKWINKGDEVEFRVAAQPGKTYTGHITFIQPYVEQKSRTVKIRAEVPNPGYDLKPQMLAEGVVKARLGDKKQLVVPASAVLWTGHRSVVWVSQPETEQPQYQYREIELGTRLEDHYVVHSGLEVGEEVVTHGTFKVDAAAQLQGKQSMMSQSKKSSNSGKAGSEFVSGKSGFITTEFTVYGNCSMCKERIEKTLNGVAGISKANWDIDSKILTVNYDTAQIQLMDIHKKVAGAGHDTKQVEADSSSYQGLPKCCRYPRENRASEKQH